MSQINRLRKSFQIEDIIKYSMVIVDEKNIIKDNRMSSLLQNNRYRRTIKSSSTLKNQIIKRLNLRAVSSRASVNNANNFISNKFKIAKVNKSSIQKGKSEDSKKDIKLDLDKYIFNFDDDILKFIKSFEEEKNNIKNNTIKLYNNMNNKKINKENTLLSNKNGAINVISSIKNNLNVEIGKIKLLCTCNNLKEFEYYFEENENNHLLENPTYLWEKYIVNNLKKYINIAYLINNDLKPI